VLGGLQYQESVRAEQRQCAEAFVRTTSVRPEEATGLGSGPCADRTHGTLADVLAGMPEVSSRLDRNAIDRLTDPRNYLGVVPQMIDGMLHGRE
jgi:hypothetical protein